MKRMMMKVAALAVCVGTMLCATGGCSNSFDDAIMAARIYANDHMPSDAKPLVKKEGYGGSWTTCSLDIDRTKTVKKGKNVLVTMDVKVDGDKIGSFPLEVQKINGEWEVVEQEPQIKAVFKWIDGKWQVVK